jgi:RHS repeat-associated protein
MGFDPPVAPGVHKDSQAPYLTVGTQGAPIPYTLTYYHLDHLGSPRLITDAGGYPVQKQHFLPFGDEMPIQAGTNSKKFTGHERDPETGMDYMMARYYEAPLGRFLSVDPGTDTDRLDPQSWNKYAYVRNNPIRRSDPTGRGGIDGAVLQYEYNHDPNRSPAQPSTALFESAGDLIKKMALTALRDGKYCGPQWTGGTWDGSFNVDAATPLDAACEIHDARTMACASDTDPLACQDAADQALMEAASKANAETIHEFFYKPALLVVFDLKTTSETAAILMRRSLGHSSQPVFTWVEFIFVEEEAQPHVSVSCIGASC